MGYYIGYNYMFRPWVWAIIRLSLDLSSNYRISILYGGLVGDEISYSVTVCLTHIRIIVEYTQRE